MLDGFVSFIFLMLRMFFIGIIMEFICFNIGRFSLLAFSFGSYPRGEKVTHNTGRITAFGVFMLLLAFITLTIVFNKST